MRGVFHRRPPKPKYDFTWDPEKVLKFLDTPTSSITSLKQLSLKLVTLLALATGQRIQTLALVKCSNIFKNETGIKIFIQDRIKSSTPASCQPCLIIPFFPQFLVNIPETSRPASKQTLSRWIKATLSEAGIDTKVFTPHSTRHASTSAACRKG
nr:unnamed protein product [Callosobruchus analis]CAI5842550.1 unnamed protein product [Callosobruchus analis]CAI5860122.1 unnamed protein product [Callosobruchus analis]CAI5865233.1 unnamed protein product [Callosobruchus analis]